MLYSRKEALSRYQNLHSDVTMSSIIPGKILRLSPLGKQGWHSGESTGSLDHMWVKFVVCCRPYSEDFSPVSPVSSLDKNQNFYVMFLFHLETVDEEPLVGYTTVNCD